MPMTMPKTNPAPDIARTALTVMVNRAIGRCGNMSELARKMGTGMSQIQRLRDTSADVQLTTMQRIAEATGATFREWLTEYSDVYGELATASIEPPPAPVEPRKKAPARSKGVTAKRRRRRA
jgi:DNA-binding phage protein